MSNDRDDNDEETERERPPTTSRLGRGGVRSYRVLNRTHGRHRGRDRFPRQRKRLPIAELIGELIQHHGLTDEVRHRAVCLYWLEIVGERFASKTTPISFADGVLRVSAINSSWVQEMQFFKARLISTIHGWVDENRIWLGPPPLVTDIRFTLGMQRRDLLVDPDYASRLRARHLARLRKTENAPPSVSDSEREAIRAETSVVIDPDLRSIIEAVRVKWNR